MTTLQGRDLTPTERAAYEFVESMVSRADSTLGIENGPPLWYGWALRDAFVAGAKWQASTAAARDVLAERRRQIEKEGWTPEHDDEHANGELARAAACYANPILVSEAVRDGGWGFWPWDWRSWKPRDARSNLVRACALILAEIERIDRKVHADGVARILPGPPDGAPPGPIDPPGGWPRKVA